LVSHWRNCKRGSTILERENRQGHCLSLRERAPKHKQPSCVWRKDKQNSKRHLNTNFFTQLQKSFQSISALLRFCPSSRFFAPTLSEHLRFRSPAYKCARKDPTNASIWITVKIMNPSSISRLC
jgi:hypothetical protein